MSSQEIVSSSVGGASSDGANSIPSSLERKMELLEERFTAPSNVKIATTDLHAQTSSSVSSSASASRHSFAFDQPALSRSSSTGLASQASTASNLPSSSIRSKRRPSVSSALRAVSMAAEKQMRKVQRSTSLSSPEMQRAASPQLPLVVHGHDRTQSMSNLPSPSVSNGSGYSNQTMQTSHRARRGAQNNRPQVVAESPPTLVSPKLTATTGPGASSDKTKRSNTVRSVLGTKSDKRKSTPVKRPLPSVTDKEGRTTPSKSMSRKRGRLQFAPEENSDTRTASSPPPSRALHQNSLDANSRERSNPSKGSKSKAPLNNKSIHDFFTTAVKKPEADKKPLALVKENVLPVSSLNVTRPRIHTLTETASTKQGPVVGSSNSKEIDRLRHRLGELEQLCHDKDEQLKAVANNQTIMHTAIKSALVDREKELDNLKDASERRSAKYSQALESSVRLESSREARELREKLAIDNARLGRIVYTRAGMHAVESWEDGHASRNLRKRVLQLREKRQSMERRLEAAQKAADFVRSNKENKDNGGYKKVCGILVDDELAAMEAEESARLHLDTIHQQEHDLAEEENSLSNEKAHHIRNLKRVASEDASRFKSRPKLHDRYVPVSLLGKGGFSEVWKAYDLLGLREVAVKIHQLDPRWSDAKKENYTKHVSREYEIHRDVRHPRIVSLFDVFEIDNNSFATVLELCQGTDLDTMLKEKRALPERDARAILLQILSGMRYLSLPSGDGSRQGIIHYDLKPGNILFDEYGDAKITDFGLSKIVDAPDPADSMELTSQGAGTYWYLPPECFVTSQSVRISNKVDVWSIGVIYYQMLFGKRPFGDGQSQDKILSNHTMLNAREVEFPGHKKVTDECKDFIKQCLTYDQAFRPTIGQLCESTYLTRKHW